MGTAAAEPPEQLAEPWPTATEPQGEVVGNVPLVTSGHDRTRFSRGFRRLLVTFGVASLGDGFIAGAVPLLAVVVDPRPFAVSAVVAANSVPWLFMALHAGAIADRFERARVMAISNLTRAAVLAAMMVVVATHHADYLLLVLFVLANATARAVYYSASQAAMTELVDSTGFNRANGILYGTEAATEDLAGPTLGTLAFAAVQSVPFLADAIAMVLSGLSLLGLRTHKPARVTRPHQLSEGIRHVVRNHDIRLLLYLIGSLAALQGLVSGVLVLIATRDWGVSASGYGAFLATQAAGLMVGAFLADRVARTIGNVAALIGCAGLSGVAYLVMGVAHVWLLAGAAFVFVGLAVGVGNPIAISLRQRVTPPELMGRVGSAWRGIVWGAAPTGALAAGGLAVVGGLRLPVFLAGGAQCVIALLLIRPLRRRIAPLDKAPSGSARLDTT
jgi:MFS family permease